MTKIVAFDLNKTLIVENSWYNLNLAMGITAEEDEQLYRRGPEGSGELSYAEWTEALIDLMKQRGKASKSNIEAVILKYSYIDGARETVATLQKQGFVTGIITGALDIVAERVAKELNMDFTYSNAKMMFGEDSMLTDIQIKGEDLISKVDAITDLQEHHPDVKDIYYVADGDNDEAVFKATKGILVRFEQTQHEDWKSKAIEEGQVFSSHHAERSAWSVVDAITDVPSLLDVGLHKGSAEGKPSRKVN